jgi:phosphate transport system protein
MRIIESDLNSLKEKTLKMGGLAESAIAYAMQAVLDRDTALSEQVIAADDAIDRLENDIDKLATDVMVLRQPAAGDLRFTVTIFHTAPVLERIADHAVNIAKHARILNEEPPFDAGINLPKMSDITQKMLRDSLHALTSGDLHQARSTIKDDDEVDDLYRTIHDEILEIMQHDSSTIRRGTEYLSIIKHLERIADYATNICEMVIYMIEGRIIKHTQEAS